MTLDIAGEALCELRRALQSCSVSFNGIKVVCDWLPGRAICSAVIVDGVLWLVLDLDKASAPRHALQMLREAANELGAAGLAEVQEAINGRVPLLCLAG